MNLFDKEERIIEWFQMVKFNQTGFIPYNFRMIKIYSLLNNKNKWKKWTNSSAKNALPPDFFHEREKIMMDVMRIDDHARENEKGKIINPTNERESKVIEELIKLNPSFKKLADEGNIIVTADSGLRGKEDHNYKLYVESFRRVVEKHLKKIPKYQNNHPGYKTMFLLFDESSPYVKCINNKHATEVGETLYAEPHFWWLDSNMLEILKESKLDYLLWFAPFKHFESKENIELPHAFLFDVSKIDYDNLIKYKYEEMDSLEL